MYPRIKRCAALQSLDSQSKTAGPGIRLNREILVILAWNMKTVVSIAALALALLLILFEVDLNPQFAMPRSVERPDAAREARFAACMDEQDRLVHGDTFAAIDNPDVQREVLARRMKEASGVCRAQYPERKVTVQEPFRFNLLDFEYRFSN